VARHIINGYRPKSGHLNGFEPNIRQSLKRRHKVGLILGKPP
jgi:hypothetical protein